MKDKKDKKIMGIMIVVLIIFGVHTAYSQYNNGNIKRFKDHVVFYPQHQDDEVLWGGTAIVDAIKECGTNNVYVTLVSDGSGVNVFKNNPKFKGIDRKEKERLRNNEFKACLNKLGVKKENIIILADEAKKPGTHYDLMEKTIINFEKKLGSVTHIAHHYKYDDHIMHRKNGQVLKKLSDEHKVDDARYFMKPNYVSNIPNDKRDIYKVNNMKDYNTVKSALEEYKNVDNKNEKYGIGYTSAHSYFDYLLNDPSLTSVLSIY